jgi:dihydroorotase (multifunctional complex type)
MPSILIESVKLLVNDKLTPAHLLLEDGIIKRIGKLKPIAGADETIRADRLIAVPGFIDAHVHLRDMKLAYKETFQTGTQAAAAGGYTTVIDMPNTQPPTSSTLNLAEKTARARGHIFTNIAFQGALIQDATEVHKMKQHGAVAFKLYLNKSLETFNSSDESRLQLALKAAKSSDALVTVHAEDGDAIRRSQANSIASGRRSIRDFLRAHSPGVEVVAVKSILKLCRSLDVRVHICHITAPQSVRLVRASRNATCEATAHHLLLDYSTFKRHGTKSICVPPVRSAGYRRGLWDLFVKGEIDILASDHAPHTLQEKTTEDAWKAASGVPGLETSLPVMLTQVWKGRLSLSRLVRSASTLPALIFRLNRKGRLQIGYDADIVLIDPKARTTIKASEFLSKAKYSPFDGMRCRGVAVCTIVNGNIVYQNGKIVGSAVGRVLRSGH